MIQTPQYRDEYERLCSKYRSQISRKTHELMNDPTPGGSRTALRGYERLCRLRAGDFRVIYAFDDKVVQLMNLRRRDEKTYDDLDESEIKQFIGFRSVTGASQRPSPVPKWESVVKEWTPETSKTSEPLPSAIAEEMLGKLKIPEKFRGALLKVTSVDELLDLQQVPSEYVEAILDQIFPRNEATAPSTPVIVLSDLVDSAAAEACGPIDASQVTTDVAPKVIVDAEPLVVITIRREEPMTRYKGNTARAIAKDARYTVKLNGKVALLYYVDNRETALLTTDAHSELVAMVNAAKRASGSAQDGGSFVINEYRHVLVPDTAGEQVLFSGAYTRDLEFKFEGALISPVAPTSIRPGDTWPGPHAGIRYTLSAGASDIRYEQDTERGTQKRVSLSDYHAKPTLDGLLGMCRAIKPNGGAIYVNEARELFAPVDDGDGYERRYIGHLGKNPWFPEPSVSTRGG